MKKPDLTKKILNSLAGKKALSVPELRGVLAVESTKTTRPAQNYAITRSIKNLAETGLIETLDGGQGEFARLTQRGKQKLAALKLDSRESLTNPNWDGKWRIVLLDLPESRKAERESLRYLLKKAGFIRLKNSAWVSPYPFEFLFKNLKKDFGLSTELIVIVTDQLDEETDKELKVFYALK